MLDGGAQPEGAEAPASLAPSRQAVRFGRLLNLARLARAYSRRAVSPRLPGETWLGCREGAAAALRRAFVLTNLQFEPADVPRRGTRVALRVGGFEIATANAGFVIPNSTETCLGFAPATIAGLAQYAFGAWEIVLRTQAAALGVKGVTVGPAVRNERIRHFACRIRGAMRAFLDHVDANALYVARRSLASRGTTLCWLTEAGHGPRRQQALQVLPVPLLAVQRQGVMPPAITEVIDAGKPLLPALGRHLGVPASALRRLSGVTVQRVGGVVASTHFPFWALPFLPQHVRLVSRRDYQAFARLADALQDAWLDSPEMARRLFAGMHPRPGADPRLAAERVVGLGDMVRDGLSHIPETGSLRFHLDALSRYAIRKQDDHGLLPWGPTEDGRLGAELAVVKQRLVPMLLRGRGLSGLLRLNAAWHQMVQTARAPRELTWPPAFPDGLPGFNGRCLVELDTVQALHAEGIALDHCIQGYAGPAVRGRCRLLSVRDPDGRPTSSAELTLRDGRLVLAQHRGYHNKEAPPADVRAVNLLLRAVEAGGVAWQPWPASMQGRHAGVDTGPFWRALQPGYPGPQYVCRVSVKPGWFRPTAPRPSGSVLVSAP
jgi:hypothetical protein